MVQRFLKKHWELVSIILVLLGGIGFIKTVATADEMAKGDEAVESRMKEQMIEWRQDTNRRLEIIDKDVKTILRTMPRR